MDDFLRPLLKVRRGSQCWYSKSCKQGVVYRLTSTSVDRSPTAQDLGLPGEARIVRVVAQTFCCPTHAIITMEEEKRKGDSTLMMEELPDDGSHNLPRE